MEVPTIQGAHITLRAIRESDIDDRLAIGRHHEFVHMCGGETLREPEYPSRDRWADWFRKTRAEDNLWIIDLGGRCIGSAGFHHISPADHSATYRIGIFDAAQHSKGIGTEATRLLLEYGFTVKKWHRIELKVLEYNHRAIRCYQKCGFKQDGILRESAFIEGRYYSDIVMSILDYEYRETAQAAKCGGFQLERPEL